MEKEQLLDISLKSDKLFQIGNFWLTNTFLESILLSLVLIIFIYLIVRKFGIKPTKTQLVAETMFMFGYDFAEKTIGDKKIAQKVYPVVATIFFVILFFNLAKFIPGLESIHFGKVHLFKPVHTDINMTLSLAIIIWLIVQFLGFYILGIKKYSSKFINFIKIKGVPVMINPLGLLEAISEVAKIFSLSLRLFLNILVGMVLILLMQKLSHYVAPVFVMLFEVFVAFLQAGVFALLSLLYVRLAIESHEKH